MPPGPGMGAPGWGIPPPGMGGMSGPPMVGDQQSGQQPGPDSAPDQNNSQSTADTVSYCIIYFNPFNTLVLHFHKDLSLTNGLFS